MTPESTVQHSVSEHAEHESAVQVHPSKEKDLHHDEHLEQIDTGGNLVYDLSEDEPEIHLRTYIACAAMILVNFVQVLALQGPPSAVSIISLLHFVIGSNRCSYHISERIFMAQPLRPGCQMHSHSCKQCSHRSSLLRRISFRHANLS